MGLSSLYDEVFMNCYETDHNAFKERTLVGISPPSSSNPITRFIKNQVEYSAGATFYDLDGVKEFNTEAEMIEYVSSSAYEKDDDHPGICFGIAVTQSDTTAT